MPSVSSVRPRAGGSSPADPAALMRLRFRRALMLLVMTLVLPGSAQLVAGRKQVGRFALRVWAVLVAAVVLLVLLGLVWPGAVFWLLSNTFVLGTVRLGLCALAIGWAALFFDAWGLGKPLELSQRRRLTVVGLNGMLCFTVAGTLLFASHVVAVQRTFIATMFGDGTVTAATHGRYNVLLLGGDSGADRWGMRPDSLTVASVDEETGRTILFGLPRNMENFPFPKGSPMARQFPHGYDCSGCELNSLVTWAGDHKAVFAKYANPGVEATSEAVEGITGLHVNYYAMVNLAGFRNLVDAVGGLTLRVRDRIPIGGIGGPITGHIEPGVQRLDGYQTLWFARSRVSADDYSRMARQKCVMNAMLQQLSPRLVVTKFEQIAKASEQLITTNLPASELGKFAQLAMKARSQKVSTVSFVPPAIDTGHPDVHKIRKMVTSAIAKAESSGDAPDKSAGPARTGSGGKAHRAGGASSGSGSAPVTTGGSIGSLKDGYAANAAGDLSSAC